MQYPGDGLGDYWGTNIIGQHHRKARELSVRTNTAHNSTLEKELTLCMPIDRQRIRRRLRISRNPTSAHVAADIRRQLDESQALRRRRQERLPTPRFDDTLPVAAKRAVIQDALLAHQVVVVCGDTGSGKSTQLPKICLAMGRGVTGYIGHTQPRRIAARSIAARLAAELDSPLGTHVGYKVRFSEHYSRDTFIKVLTDGMLLAEIEGDRRLYQYDTIIIDEAHERSLNIDFLLGFIKGLLPKRPDLKLIITSATIDPQQLAQAFGRAPIIDVSGRRFPVEVRYRPLRDTADDRRDRNIQAAIVHAVDELGRERNGDILVFLAGEQDIRNTSELLRKRRLPNTEILPLYARLSALEQQRVFQEHDKRRIVLATNVAETSLTVPGIRYVIDSGYARISRYSPGRQVQRLPIESISQASADQRAGRCGRTAAGICIRLYSEDDYQARPRFTDPEILRTSLAAVILTMRYLRLGEVETFPFIDPPHRKLVNDGYRLLLELGAVDGDRALTRIGRQLAKLPVDPRIGRMLISAGHGGCLSEVVTIAAALAIQDPREYPQVERDQARAHHRRYDDHRSDFIGLLALWSEYQKNRGALSARQLRNYCRDNYLSWWRMREWSDVRRQLLDFAREMKLNVNREPADYDAIHRALLAGLLGNIACRQERHQYEGTSGKRLYLHPGSALFRKSPKWIMAAELVDTDRLYARVVAPIKPGWVEPLAAHLLHRDYLEPYWDSRAGRAMVHEQASLMGLTIITRRKVRLGPINPGLARHIFIREGLVGGRIKTQGDFLPHNQDLITRIEDLEHKTRRRDILVDAEHVFRFYDDRLPDDVYSTPRFETWRRSAERADPRLLHLSEQDLMQRPAHQIPFERFPDHLDIAGNRLALRYHFAPGHPHDGVTAVVPVSLLNQLPDDRFSWVVPGLLHEKIIGLIKSLPKSTRRRLVPAPEYATRCLEYLTPGDGPLSAALTRALRQLAGVTIAQTDFDESKLPPHLFFNFAVIADNGEPIAYGRNLAQLRAGHGHHAQAYLDKNVALKIERSGITAWDFGVLPQTVAIDQDGIRVHGYPALVDATDSVALQVFDSKREADRAMRGGIHRLLLLSMPQQKRYLAKNLPHIAEMCLAFATRASCATLKQDLTDAIVDRAAFPGGCDIRDAQAFAACVARARKSLMPVATELCDHVHNILCRYRRLMARLDTDDVPDIRSQLEHLIFPGFVGATPAPWLTHYPRYLEAVEQRLERRARAPAKDQSKGKLLAPFWERYLQHLATGEGGTKEFVRYRWMVEEYRVSLFAQELGTAVPVSPKRLATQWQHVLAAGHGSAGKTAVR